MLIHQTMQWENPSLRSFSLDSSRRRIISAIKMGNRTSRTSHLASSSTSSGSCRSVSDLPSLPLALLPASGHVRGHVQVSPKATILLPSPSVQHPRGGAVICRV
ncbi:hypothetical protein SEVIR_9G547450v4 [Setaria viridis]